MNSKIFSLIVILFLISSCGGDERLNMKYRDVLKSDLVKDKVITQDERLDMSAYWYCMPDENTVDKTVTEMLDLSKDYKESIFADVNKEKEQKIFKAYRAVAEMDDYLDVRLENIWFISDSRVQLQLWFLNKTEQVITGIKGDYVLRDEFGDALTVCNVKSTKEIAPFDSVSVISDDGWLTGPERKRLAEYRRRENFEGLTHYYWPLQLLLFNGTKIEANFPKK